MKTMERGISVPRAGAQRMLRFHGLAFCGLPAFVLVQLVSVDYSGVPWQVWPFIGLIFGGFIWFFLLGAAMALFCLERIELDRMELRVCLGPVVLCRRPVRSIRTVCYGEIGFGRGNPTYEGFVLLSTSTRRNIEEEGRRILARKPSARRSILSQGMALDNMFSWSQVRIERRITRLLFGLEQDILMGYDHEHLQAILPYLTNAQNCTAEGEEA